VDNLVLKSWQEKASDKWMEAGSKGIIEAVTGSGKSYLAMGCWRKLLEQNSDLEIRTVVVVPNLTLLHQFAEKWIECFPQMSGKVGKYYGDQKDKFTNNHVIVSTIQSFIKHGHDLLRRINVLKWKKLLIADECHRYIIGEHFKKVRIDFYWDYVLAITATLDSEEYEVDGFGCPVVNYTFGDAINDGLISEFSIINCALELSSQELRDYKELTNEISEQVSYVKDYYSGVIKDLEMDLFGTLKKYLEKHPDETPIRRLFGLIFRRATIWYTAEEKIAVATDLILYLVNKHKRKVLVFFERISSIEDMEENFILPDEIEHYEDRILNPYIEGIKKEEIDGWIGSMHSDLDLQKRKEVLESFKECQQGVLFACKMLDEGWDVPEIDAAILVSSSKSKTQRIQRIGRTLRKSEKKSLIITLNLPQTKEVDVIINDEDIFEGAAEIHRCTRDDIFSLVDELEDSGSGKEDDPAPEKPEISIDENLYRVRSNHWAYKHDLNLQLGEEKFIVLLELTKDPKSLVPDKINERYKTKLSKIIDSKFKEPRRLQVNFEAPGLNDVGSFIIPADDDLEFIHQIPKIFYAFVFWEGDDLILWERESENSRYHWTRHSWKELEEV
jgi:superfamily II DNA or RNA helicase